jgi:hypothetical protein
MDRREDATQTELCVVCGEEVGLTDSSSHARVQGRTICRRCSHRLGGVYDPERETWTRPPKVPESLRPRED